jgi:hypothetical protein
MSARKTALMTVVLLGVCALVAGCGSDSDSPTSPPVDEAPILPPQNVTAGSSENSKLMLSWDPNTQNKLAGYNVYRVTLDTEHVELLTPYFITVTSFEDMSSWLSSRDPRTKNRGERENSSLESVPLP